MIVNRYTTDTVRGSVKREGLFLSKFLLRFLRHGFRHRSVLFYPDYPDRRAAIARVLDSLGYNITNNPRLKCQLAFHWEDATYRDPCPLLEELAGRIPVINLHCRDISKQHVEDVFRETFGYPSFVDPLTHRGPCVRKSQLNAQHDGTILECPLEQTEPGFIYQKLLKQIDEEGFAVDYRVAVFGNSLAGFATRQKTLEDRFAHTIRERLDDYRRYLSDEEVVKILRFCRRLHIDYGELDMIRDQDDGRLYLLDANNTPFRPPPDFNVSESDRTTMRRQYQQAFREQLSQGVAPGEPEAAKVYR